MDRLRKMSSKVFKKAPKPSSPPPLPLGDRWKAMQHARSMPLRDENFPNPSKPVYRGTQPLRPEDIVYTNLPPPVNNFQQEPDVMLERRGAQRGRERRPRYDDEYDSSDDEDNNVISPGTVSQFPPPPGYGAPPNAPVIPPAKPTRYQPVYPDDYPNANDLLPPFDYASFVNRSGDALKTVQARRQPTLQRVDSNASFSRPSHVAYFNANNQPIPRPLPIPGTNRNPQHSPNGFAAHRIRREQSLNRVEHSSHHVEHASHRVDQSARGGEQASRPHGDYRSASLFSRGGPRMAPGPSAQRPVVRQASSPVFPELGIYNPRVMAAVRGPEYRQVVNYRAASPEMPFVITSHRDYEGKKQRGQSASRRQGRLF